MMAAAGHMEHMPAHIFQRVGRYADAAEANRRGAAADLAYFARTRPLDYYAGYTAHNYLFLAFSTVMQGRRAETLDAARKARAVVPDEQLLETPGSDWRMTELYAAMVRFGMWDAILAEPAPNAKLTGLTGGCLYARSIALAATGRVADARQSLAALEKLAATTTTNGHVFAIAILVARARIASTERDDDQAIALLTEAVTREDRLGYAEPAMVLSRAPCAGGGAAAERPGRGGRSGLPGGSATQSRERLGAVRAGAVTEGAEARCRSPGGAAALPGRVEGRRRNDNRIGVLMPAAATGSPHRSSATSQRHEGDRQHRL
jgi:hypothetical protein